MDAYDCYLNELVNLNKSVYSKYSNIKWVNAYNSSEYQNIREQLLDKTGNSVLFNNTKPYLNHLSKGCNLCGKGLWSCLFITGKCNANCFYCPTSQIIDDVSGSQGLTFPTAESYAEYVNFFKFKGVSFSGGEPLLVADRVLNYLEQIRKTCSPDIYTWMYTNGILANDKIFNKLAEHGLNEVRFDIGATAYNLDKIKFAKGIIPNISIEIPAVPEEKERLKELLPEMVKAGVSNLNLHQLRLTEYNAEKLLKHNYTFIPAEKPIVLESELAALEIIEYAREQKIDIGINYCSFFFKNRFQQVGFRKIVANAISNNGTIINNKGFIRAVNENKIRYYSTRIADEGKLSVPFETLQLKNKTYCWKNELVHNQIISDNGQLRKTINLINKEPDNIPDDEDLFEIWRLEYIEKGLREY
ncbi:MAG: radical SAM protein [Bacteroidales bacterium]|nr:radical SAM protein [Bacteroidales bacterium]